MDDLTKINGIDKATAKKLVAAGVDSIVKLATASDETMVAAKIAGGPAQWGPWIAEAKSLVPAAPVKANEPVQTVEQAPSPLDLVTAQGDEIDSRAAEIDAARDALMSAGAARQAAQIALDQADSVDVRDAALAQVAEADAAVVSAIQVLDALIGAGTESVIPTQPNAPVVAAELGRGDNPNSAHTTQSDADNEGGAGDPAGSAAMFAIAVTGPRNGRRRIGRVFGPVATAIDVTEDELDAIDADPKLSWEPAPQDEEN